MLVLLVALVEPVALVDAVELLAYVDPLVELVAPEVAALALPVIDVLPLAVEVSLLATALLVEGVVLVEAVDEVSLLAKPLVLPVWLRELLALVDGEEVADVLALFAD